MDRGKRLNMEYFGTKLQSFVADDVKRKVDSLYSRLRGFSQLRIKINIVEWYGASPYPDGM